MAIKSNSTDIMHNYKLSLKPYNWQSILLIIFLIVGLFITGACHDTDTEDETNEPNIEPSTTVKSYPQAAPEDAT